MILIALPAHTALTVSLTGRWSYLGAGVAMTLSTGMQATPGSVVRHDPTTRPHRFALVRGTSPNEFFGIAWDSWSLGTVEVSIL